MHHIHTARHQQAAILYNGMARDGWARDLVLGLPTGGVQFLTWTALTLEILFLPLAIWRWTRPLIWLALVGMHIGIVALVSFADLSAGMLMLHLFTIDARWFAMVRLLSDRLVRSLSYGIPAGRGAEQ